MQLGMVNAVLALRQSPRWRLGGIRNNASLETLLPKRAGRGGFPLYVTNLWLLGASASGHTCDTTSTAMTATREPEGVTINQANSAHDVVQGC